jgi:hypothetical protein
MSQKYVVMVLGKKFGNQFVFIRMYKEMKEQNVEISKKYQELIKITRE